MYMTHIPIGKFGNLVYLETLIVFLTAFLSYGIAPAHQRFFYIEKEKNSYGVYLFNNFFGSFVLIVVSILPILFFSTEIATVLCKDSELSGIVNLSMWIVLTEILFGYSLQILQYEESPLQFMLYSAFKLIITFALTYILVVNFSKGIEGVIIARLAGGCLIVLCALVLVILPRCTFIVNLKSIKQSIIFGLPFVLSTLGYTMFTLSDRFMLNWLSTSEEVGKYGFGLKIANFINLIFVQTIGMSYFPSVMRNELQENNFRYYRKMLTYYCFIIALLILGFLFFYQNILWVIGKNMEYWDGLKVVPILSLSFMVMGMNYFVGVGLFLKNQTKHYLIPSFTALTINILMNLWLIPIFGMVGAAFSVVVAQILYTGLLAYFSNRYMKINFEWNKILMIYCIAIMCFFSISYTGITNNFFSIIAKIIALLVFPFILYKLKFFEQIEIQRFKEGVAKLYKRIFNIL